MDELRSVLYFVSGSIESFGEKETNYFYYKTLGVYYRVAHDIIREKKTLGVLKAALVAFKVQQTQSVANSKFITASCLHINKKVLLVFFSQFS